ncbi:hypothetical protein CKAH01_03124 [Colletotrichum kahawae]|uniref:Uncharacterized protein n=1 Tax=Colletotrichum kahawae TaxID=34407 RepID=A0AAE0DD72_COLKA|nr:hypothetical protein CKAH01_03124 [Colletotrichum kahawae]
MLGDAEREHPSLVNLCRSDSHLTCAMWTGRQ